MKKQVMIWFFMLFLVPFALAADLDVTIADEDNTVLLAQGDEDARFTLEITNNEDASDKFEIFSLVGVSIFPKDQFTIANGSTKTLEVRVVPHQETRRDVRGFYTFEYQIKGKDTGFYTDRLTIKLIDALEIIEVESSNIGMEDTQANIIVRNTEVVDVEDVTVTVKSQFFEATETISLLAAGEEETITVPINGDLSGIPAGEYLLGVTIEAYGEEVVQTKALQYLERGGVISEKETTGFIVRSKTITKTNQGNIETTAKIIERKDVLSRLFTTFSQAPLDAERKGLVVDYVWEEELGPGESLVVEVTSNYTLPFIIILLIIAVGVGVKIVLSKTVQVRKSVSFVKTRGGEFALKVQLRIKSRQAVENLRVSDRMPRLAKLYSDFGTKPSSVDGKTRRLLWEIPRLARGEERVITYIMYSKLKVIGRFELPAAHVAYTKDGTHEEVLSNKTTFAAETVDD